MTTTFWRGIAVFQKALDWVYNRLLDNLWLAVVGTLAALAAAVLAWFEERTLSEKITLVLVLLVVSVAFLSWAAAIRTARAAGQKLSWQPSSAIVLASVLVLTVVVLFRGSVASAPVAAIREPLPGTPAPPTLSEIVSTAFVQGKLRANPANPVDRSRAFHYEVFLPQGTAQLYADVGGPTNIVTVEEAVPISVACYEMLITTTNGKLNSIGRALLPAGINANTGIWYDTRHVLLKRELYVSPDPMALVVTLNEFSWAGRVGREMTENVCSEAG